MEVMKWGKNLIWKKAIRAFLDGVRRKRFIDAHILSIDSFNV